MEGSLPHYSRGGCSTGLVARTIARRPSILGSLGVLIPDRTRDFAPRRAAGVSWQTSVKRVVGGLPPSHQGRPVSSRQYFSPTPPAPSPLQWFLQHATSGASPVCRAFSTSLWLRDSGMNVKSTVSGQRGQVPLWADSAPIPSCIVCLSRPLRCRASSFPCMFSCLTAVAARALISLERVFHLKDAIIAKFKLDVSPQRLILFKLDGTRTPLNPAHMLSEAGVTADTTLVVEVATRVDAQRGAASLFC